MKSGAPDVQLPPSAIVNFTPNAGTSLELPRLPVLGFSALDFRAASKTPSIQQSGTALITTSARAAFLHALRALGVRPGDRVLVPTYHCPTMVSPVTRLGAVPVFYPISSSGLPSDEFLASADTDGVKAMLAAHFFGLPLSMQRVRDFCDSRNIALVEDCAHAFFGELSGRAVGSVGDMAIASLPKFFPVSEGGCLVGPEHLLTRVRLGAAPLWSELRNVIDLIEIGTRFHRFGSINGLLRTAFAAKGRIRGRSGLRSEELDESSPIDVSSEHDPWLDDAMVARRATKVTAWLMEHVDRGGIVQIRRRNYELLSELMSGLPTVRPLFPKLPAGAAPYVFPLEVDQPHPLYGEVRAARVPVFRWDRLWPGNPILEGDAGARWARHVFQIGCHQDLREEDIRAMARVLRELLSRVGS